MPTRQNPAGAFCCTRFTWLGHCCIYLCNTHPLAGTVLWISPRVTRQVGRWPHHLVHGTGYKTQTGHDLCTKGMWQDALTTLKIWCITSILAVTPEAVTYTEWRSGRGLHPVYINKASNVATYFLGRLTTSAPHSSYSSARLGLGIQHIGSSTVQYSVMASRTSNQA